MTQVRADGQPIDRPEEAWFGASSATLRQLHTALVEDGVSPPAANGLIGWLMAGDADTFASVGTRARYRRELRKYEPPRGGKPGVRPMGRPAHKSRGRKLAAVLAFTSAVGVAGLAGRAAESPSTARTIGAALPSADKTRSCRDEESEATGELAEAA